MLIKNIVRKNTKTTRKGDAIPYTPEEALAFAVEYGAKSQNTKDKIFWVMKGSVKKSTFSFLDNPVDKTWQATATGTALIGYTDVKTDKFFKPKIYQFTINYKSGKDVLGMPDIKVVSMQMEPKDMDPQRLMGFPAMSVEQTGKAAPKPVEGPKPVAVEAKKDPK